MIVGGGINGAGIARDAAGRGLSVTLVEKDDLASHTSRWSSKLIHGGLRYLEYYEFRLVREALIEREVLLRAAPHIVWPLTFVLPHSPEQRPAWLIRLGLLLYDHLGGRQILPGSTSVDLTRPGALGEPLKPWVKRGFTYADCWVEDSRLVALNALDAAERGAEIRTRTRCERARRDGGGWAADLVDGDGRRSQVRARALVNAAGPWVSSFLGEGLGVNSAKRVRLIKGSHIVVPRLYSGDHPYILQNVDKRIVFVIPFEGVFSLIGTTDVPYEGDPAAAAIEPGNRLSLRGGQPLLQARDCPERRGLVLCGRAAALRRCQRQRLGGDQGLCLRPRCRPGRAPLLSVFGGKITTYRKLAEHALEKLQPVMASPAALDRRCDPSRRRHAGGRFPGVPCLGTARASVGAGAAAAALGAGVRDAPGRHCGEASRIEDLGRDLGGGLYEAEVALSGRAGMGAHRRRHPVAALAARPACRPGHGGAPRGDAGNCATTPPLAMAAKA